jgi:soluble lytic murein transglycosylase-like protein
MARARAVPPALVKAIIAQESRFLPNATGLAGERGLMQLMATTARGLGFTGHLDLLYDVRNNIGLGTRLLSENFRQAGGRWDVAIAAYNAGWDRSNIHDARRKADGSFTNQSYVDDVMENWGYFDPSATLPQITKRGNGGKGVAGMGGVLGIVALVLAWLFTRGR